MFNILDLYDDGVKNYIEDDYDNNLEDDYDIWITKDGRKIPIRNMSHSHLYNAYKKTNQPVLLREMTLRLFHKQFINK